MKCLLANKVSAASVGREGSAFSIASKEGFLEIVEHPVHEEMAPDEPNHSLRIASGYGCLEVVKYLANGADQSPDSYGTTPLYRAVLCSHYEVVEYLLANGADHTPDTEGRTPLHVASSNRCRRMKKLLVSGGAPALNSLPDIRRYI